MKLYKVLTRAVTVLAVLAFAALPAFAEEVQQVEAACAEAAASVGLIPLAVASLIIPATVFTIRRRRAKR